MHIEFSSSYVIAVKQTFVACNLNYLSWRVVLGVLGVFLPVSFEHCDYSNAFVKTNFRPLCTILHQRIEFVYSHRLGFEPFSFWQCNFLALVWLTVR